MARAKSGIDNAFNHNERLDSSYLDHRLRQSCPQCEAGQPTIVTGAKGGGRGRFVRCESCGYRTEVITGAIKTEVMQRAVRRWNKLCARV